MQQIKFFDDVFISADYIRVSAHANLIIRTYCCRTKITIVSE